MSSLRVDHGFVLQSREYDVVMDGASRWDEDEVRASDEERDQVVNELRKHVEDGRITLEEFRQRLDEVYAAKTRRETGVARRELPKPVPMPTGSEKLGGIFGSNACYFACVATPSIVCVGVWLASSADGSFWPAWVMLASGAAALRRFAHGGRAAPRAKSDPDRDQLAS